MAEIYRVYERPNEMITIVGSLAQISANAVELLISLKESTRFILLILKQKMPRT